MVLLAFLRSAIGGKASVSNPAFHGLATSFVVVKPTAVMPAKAASSNPQLQWDP